MIQDWFHWGSLGAPVRTPTYNWFWGPPPMGIWQMSGIFTPKSSAKMSLKLEESAEGFFSRPSKYEIYKFWWFESTDSNHPHHGESFLKTNKPCCYINHKDPECWVHLFVHSSYLPSDRGGQASVLISSHQLIRWPHWELRQNMPRSESNRAKMM